MKDIPGAFGSSDVNNFKQTTITTTTEGQQVLIQMPHELTSKQQKLLQQQLKMKEILIFKFDMNKFNLDMKDLPEAFVSSDMSNF